MATATALSPLLPLFSYFFSRFFLFFSEKAKKACVRKKMMSHTKNFCARLESEIMKGGGASQGAEKSFQVVVRAPKVDFKF